MCDLRDKNIFNLIKGNVAVNSANIKRRDFFRKEEREREKKGKSLRDDPCDNENMSFVRMTKPGMVEHVRKIHLQTSHIVVPRVRCSQGEPGQYGVHLNNGTIHVVPDSIVRGGIAFD